MEKRLAWVLPLLCNQSDRSQGRNEQTDQIRRRSIRNGRQVFAENVLWGIENPEDKPLNLLEELVWAKEREIEVKRQRMPLPLMKSRLEKSDAGPTRDLESALSKLPSGECTLFFRYVRCSPEDTESAPTLANVAAEKNDAKAIVVNTESRHFYGNYEDIRSIRQVVPCPVICQDIFVYPWQLYDARFFQADACVLIMKILGLKDTLYFSKATSLLGMAPIIEVHDSSEIELLLDAKRRQRDHGQIRFLLLAKRDLNSLAPSMSDSEALLVKFAQDAKHLGIRLMIELPREQAPNATLLRDLDELGADAVLASAMREDRPL
jgi:indole-3-glycerol phosphate synthase